MAVPLSWWSQRLDSNQRSPASEAGALGLYATLRVPIAVLGLSICDSVLTRAARAHQPIALPPSAFILHPSDLVLRVGFEPTHTRVWAGCLLPGWATAASWCLRKDLNPDLPVRSRLLCPLSYEGALAIADWRLPMDELRIHNQQSAAYLSFSFLLATSSFSLVLQVGFEPTTSCF